MKSSAKWFWRLIRAYEWWHYKFPLALGAGFAIAWTNHISFSMLLVPTVLTVLAGLSAAIWASVFNDFMDLDQDRLAGKSTPMMQLSAAWQSSIIVFSLVLMLAASWLLYRYATSLLIVASIWSIYTAYSLPPIRLKERGTLGVLSVAFGEHVLFGLLAVSLVLECTGSSLASISGIWLAAFLGWSVTYGLRGIIWHQLCDIENDLRANCKTLAVLIGARNLTRIAEHYLFPVEVLCFALLLIFSQCYLSLFFLPLYAITEWMRCKYFTRNLIVAAPKPNPSFIMLEYYQIFFPLSFLIMGLLSDYTSVLLVAFFVVLFPAPIAQLVNQIRVISKCLVYDRIIAALRTVAKS